MQKRPETLEEWVDYLAKEEFPVLSQTMHRMANIDDMVNDFSTEMASIILQDPNMTARVLKMANSAYYNVGLKRINTISRAVMFLGYDTIRSICLTSGVFQSLLKKDPDARLMRAVAGSFQAAVQSHHFSEAREEKNPEELFIGSLLFHIGEMAFWTFGGSAAREINDLMRDEGLTQIEAQEEVLGFRLSELTIGLVEQWGLGNVMLNALRRKDTPESQSRNIILSHRLVNASSRGWTRAHTKKVIEDLSGYTKLSLQDTRKLIVTSAEQTVEVLKGHGFDELINSLVLPPGTSLDNVDYQPRKLNIVKGKDPKAKKAPDQEVIDDILGELTTLESESEQLDINLVLQLVLESIHRGVGMDRALFAIVEGSTGKLRGKYAVQDRETNLVQDFVFTLEATPLLLDVLKEKKVVWSKRAVRGPLAGELLSKFQVMLGTNDFLCGPLMVQGRAIGLYYADRQITKQDLGLLEFDAFKQVVGEANRILEGFGR